LSTSLRSKDLLEISQISPLSKESLVPGIGSGWIIGSEARHENPQLLLDGFLVKFIGPIAYAGTEKKR
jgi:hypothetical protein